MSSRRRGGSDKGDTKQLNDLWAKLVKERDQQKSQEISSILQATESNENKGSEKQANPSSNGRESYVLFVGDKQAGKSSLIVQFLNPNKDDKPKPTVALEYTFGRRSNTTTTAKDIAHIWELAGGMPVAELLQVPITPERLRTAVVVIVVDLERPGGVIPSVMKWLELIRAQIKECFAKLSKQQPDVAKLLKSRAQKKLESSAVEPSPIPIVIIASKYDTFSNHDSVKRKTLGQALRYVAHLHGATLMSVSLKNKSTMNHFRMHMNHHIFGTPLAKKTRQDDPTNPFLIAAGSDNFESIGRPKNTRADQFEGSSIKARIDKWQQAVNEYFEPVLDESAKSKSDLGGASGESIFKESEIDAMRAQKEEELVRYRRMVERKLRMQNASSSSSEKGAGTSEKRSSEKRSSSKSAKAAQTAERKAAAMERDLKRESKDEKE